MTDGEIKKAFHQFYEEMGRKRGSGGLGETVFTPLEAFAAGVQAAQLTAAPAQAEPKLTPCRHCGFRVALNEAPAQAEPVADRLYRHPDSDDTYTYLFTAEAAGAAKRDGMREIEVYQGEDGRGWYRYPADFTARMIKVEGAAE